MPQPSIAAPCRPSLIVLFLATTLLNFGCSGLQQQSGSLPGSDQANVSTFLGVATQEGGYDLHTAYRHGVVYSQDNTTDQFLVGAQLHGISLTGSAITLTIDHLNDTKSAPDWPVPEFSVQFLGEAPPTKTLDFFDCLPTYAARCQGINNNELALEKIPEWCPQDCSRPFDPWTEGIATYGHDDSVLFTSGPAKLQHVKTSQVVLNSGEQQLIGRECARLWHAALNELAEDQQHRTYEITRQEFVIPEGEQSVVSLWMQARIINDDQSRNDPRGAFFILYDLDKQSIVYSTFGHCEWAVGSKIEFVRPYLWFRVGHDPRLFILTDKTGAYEDTTSGWTIIEHATGAVVSQSQ